MKHKFQPDFPDSPERELFIWAVLCNRRELAKLFWRNSKDHIGTKVHYCPTRNSFCVHCVQFGVALFVTGGALMASALLKALSWEADKQEEVDLSLDLNAHAK